MDSSCTPEDKQRAPIPRTEGVRGARWKYIRFPDQVPVYEQLFDLEKDPLEQRSVLADPANESIVKKLRAICDAGPVSR